MSNAPLIFKDRHEAGKLLAEKLVEYKPFHPVVFSIPSGGVPIAYAISHTLHSPLDIIISESLCSEDFKNCEFGAVASGEVITIDRSIQKALHISDEELNKSILRALRTIKKKMIAYSSGSHSPHGEIDTAILVDDGSHSAIAIRAALEALMLYHNPKKIIFASPICPMDTTSFIQNAVDKVIYLSHPPHIFSVQNWYEEFPDISDSYILKLLKIARNFSSHMLNNHLPIAG